MQEVAPNRCGTEYAPFLVQRDSEHARAVPPLIRQASSNRFRKRGHTRTNLKVSFAFDQK